MNDAAASATPVPDTEAELERFRNYLRFLAEIKLDRRLRNRMDASDIVQDTMLRAYAAWSTFRGNSPEQRLAWLRQILMRSILHALRDARCAKRDVTREQRLDVIIDNSSRQIEAWLAASGESPSEGMQQAEELMRVADAVFQLPDAERVAIIGYYWQRGTLADIGEDLGRSVPAVAGLLHRGVQRLRGQLVEIN